jgi:hypothetical protein
MTDDGHCTNPGSRRVFAYRAIQKEWRSRPEYREKSAAFLKKHPWCEVWLAVGVKVPATEIHHPNKWSYMHGFEVYADFENNGAIAVSGRKGGGHYACHHNQKVCPICKKKKCDQYAEACQSCLKEKYPKLAKALEESAERKKAAEKVRRKVQKTKSKKPAAFLSFPCKFRLQEQHCEKGGICGYSKENYQKCRQAQERPARRK